MCAMCMLTEGLCIEFPLMHLKLYGACMLFFLNNFELTDKVIGK